MLTMTKDDFSFFPDVNGPERNAVMMILGDIDAGQYGLSLFQPPFPFTQTTLTYVRSLE
jgi:hypothetical protein